MKPIVVLGTPIDIKFQPGLVKNEGLQGKFSELTYEITLDPDLPEKSLHYTFWHEVAHAWMHENGLSLVLTDKLQEMIAQSLTSLIINTVLIKR